MKSLLKVFWVAGLLCLVVASSLRAQNDPPPITEKDQQQIPESGRKLFKLLMPEAASATGPATTKLVFPYLHQENSYAGYYTFTLQKGVLYIEHYCDNYLGFAVPELEAQKLAPISFAVSFIINGEFAIDGETLLGRETATIRLLGTMPSIAIQAVNGKAEKIFFSRWGGYLDDQAPLAPKVGEKVTIANSYEDFVETYDVESRTDPDFSGTEIFKLRDSTGGEHILRVYLLSAFGRQQLNADLDEYNREVRAGRPLDFRVVTTGTNYILQTPLRPDQTSADPDGPCFAVF